MDARDTASLLEHCKEKNVDEEILEHVQTLVDSHDVGFEDEFWHELGRLCRASHCDVPDSMDIHGSDQTHPVRSLS